MRVIGVFYNKLSANTKRRIFYETHHNLSHRAGGVWTSLVFNGEQSPIVSEKTLKKCLRSTVVRTMQDT